MGGGEWQTHSKQRKRPLGSLSGWCDANLPTTKGAKIAGLIAKKEASERVVGILKAYQKRGAVLGSAQRLALEAELQVLRERQKKERPLSARLQAATHRVERATAAQVEAVANFAEQLAAAKVALSEDDGSCWRPSRSCTEQCNRWPTGRRR